MRTAPETNRPHITPRPEKLNCPPHNASPTPRQLLSELKTTIKAGLAGDDARKAAATPTAAAAQPSLADARRVLEILVPLVGKPALKAAFNEWGLFRALAV